ncbi:Myb-like DNA-binding domain-containing protein [Spironucleus salmonicida]|uniref:Myb-like DNA-binding domain-containing protein n=1 Tax=Spironucleus salmonicida TaxID=348837 RepID=V6LGV6_9EUKA|nr:Myb-like DNA-binding domain-containing protein [Spironucleus salmonicida]KAH0574018.1 Myb-like DNA-binding domain-containing protein [Spironucleus salmonicida]|eukprot:EST42941.1 Myb-like DNA-binding domain-containing protein [Spironucleus salmonicida]
MVDTWTYTEEDKLLQCIQRHGTKWNYIRKTYFSSRTAASLRNKYIKINQGDMESRNTEDSIMDLIKTVMQIVEHK